MSDEQRERAAQAVVLLSGGMDSAVTLAMAIRQGFVAHALSFRYGQRHAVELESARALAAALGAAEHVVIDLDLARFGGSALTARGALARGGGGAAPTGIPAQIGRAHV